MLLEQKARFFADVSSLNMLKNTHARAVWCPVVSGLMVAAVKNDNKTIFIFIKEVNLGIMKQNESYCNLAKV